MYFTVSGVDETSGKETDMGIFATNEQKALEIARAKGIQVTQIAETLPPSIWPRDTRQRITIPNWLVTLLLLFVVWIAVRSCSSSGPKTVNPVESPLAGTSYLVGSRSQFAK